jgi:hypothetical protein
LSPASKSLPKLSVGNRAVINHSSAGDLFTALRRFSTI